MVEPPMDNGMRPPSAGPATSDGEQTKTMGHVACDGAQPSLSGPVIASGMQPQAAVSIDSVTKVLALIVVFLYVSGFLITSLHNFQYGFSEINPLRPRILAAGGWFAIFIAVPFALVLELKKHSALKEKSNLYKFSSLILAYVVSANILSIYSGVLFTFDDASVPTGGDVPWWKVVLIALGGLAALVAFVFVLEKAKEKLPKWVIPACTLGFFAYVAWSAYYRIFVKHLFDSSAVNLWLFAVGGFFFFEFSKRDWVLRFGYWQRTLIGFFTLMTIFANVYYPHIMAKWGGGALIPVELAFSKDAPVRSDLQIDCLLIDESDAGFYVVRKGESSATFIPRAEVSSIYYAQGNKRSLFSEGLPQELQPVPAAKPPSDGVANEQANPPHQPLSEAAPRPAASTKQHQEGR